MIATAEATPTAPTNVIANFMTPRIEERNIPAAVGLRFTSGGLRWIGTDSFKNIEVMPATGLEKIIGFFGVMRNPRKPIEQVRQINTKNARGPQQGFRSSRFSPHAEWRFSCCNTLRMKTITRLISSFVGVAAFAALAYGGGTDVLHLSLQEAMSNTGVETNAAGTLSLVQNVQGKADKQLLTAQITGLTSNSTYVLFAGILDTNLAAVTNFSTDDLGNAGLPYGAPPKGKNNTALPDGLNPLRDVRSLAVGTIVTNILSIDTNIVLYADLSLAGQFQYLVKRDVSNTNGITANIRLKANPTAAHFRLLASGLAATTGYIFAVNDEFAETVTSDAKGRVNFTAAPDPTEVLSVHSVALWDNTSNVVFRATLP